MFSALSREGLLSFCKSGAGDFWVRRPLGGVVALAGSSVHVVGVLGAALKSSLRQKS